MFELFDKLPDSIREALIALALSTIAGFAVAIQQWLKARFAMGALANTVEAIHAEGCVDCAKRVKVINQADGIEDKANVLITKIKADADAKPKVE